MGSLAPPPVPEVPVYDAATATPEEVVKGLIIAGGAVIRNAVPLEDVEQIKEDIQPWIDADYAWEEGSFFPPETRRAYGLAGKSKKFITSFVQNKLYQDVCDAILTTKSQAWNGLKRETSVSKPQLNTTIAFDIGPGAKAQQLHRDDM